MLRYITVLLPGLYYITAFGYGSIISEFYDFNAAQTGLILSIPLIIGSLVGVKCRLVSGLDGASGR
jgi:hypothetical protein